MVFKPEVKMKILVGYDGTNVAGRLSSWPKNMPKYLMPKLK
jgi:hypothetical protein